MNIIYLHQYFKFPNENGGIRSYVLSTGFVKEGHVVEVVTSTSEKEFKSGKRWIKVEKDGLVVHYIYLPYGNHFPYFRRKLVFFQFLWFSTVKLLSLKGDVVLATSTPLTIGIPALVKKWIQSTPFVFEARDVWPEAVIAIGVIKNKIVQNLLYRLEYIIYKNSLAIVPLSIDMKHSIVSRYPELNRKTIEVIENISEINRFQTQYDALKSNLKEKIGFKPRFTILYAGTFGRVNGLSYVVRLAKKLIVIDPTIVFVLVGDGVEKDVVTQEAKNEGVYDKNVFILGSMTKEELPQLYYECSMGSSFVIDVKELWANSANKFFDTLAASKPILINHDGWQRDVISNSNIGYVLPCNITEKSAQEFALYTQNDKLISNQQENCLKVAVKDYSSEVAVSRYINIFKKIMF